jgi:hypothetical protein
MVASSAKISQSGTCSANKKNKATLESN